MSEPIRNLLGTSSSSFSIGLKAVKVTLTATSTTLGINKILDMNSNKIVNVANPVDNGDAVNLGYLNTQLSGKADKVSGATNGNFAGLDANGNLTDSGYDYTDFVLASEKGAANGVATLDAGGKIPVAQLPNSVMEFLGAWDASTNTPTLADGTGNAGDTYRVSVEGTQNLGSGNITFYVGDFIMYSGSVWQRSPMASGVISVNGQVGVVSLDTDDISEGSTNLYFTDERAQDAVGAMVADSNSIDITYTDATPELKADLRLDGATLTIGVNGVKVTDNTFQPLDATLTALAGLSATAGIIVETAEDTFTKRSIAGTTDRISVTNGDGVSGNPTIDIGSKVLTDDSTHTLTNKTFDANGTGNSISNLEVADFAGSAIETSIEGLTDTDTAMPTSAAVKDYVDAQISGDIVASVRTIKIPVALVNTASTFAVPDGCIVKSVSCIIGSAYSAGATIAVSVGATTIMATTENDAETTGQYDNVSITEIASGAVVSVTVGNAPASGSATIYVDFVSAPLS